MKQDKFFCLPVCASASAHALLAMALAVWGLLQASESHVCCCGLVVAFGFDASKTHCIFESSCCFGLDSIPHGKCDNNHTHAYNAPVPVY